MSSYIEELNRVAKEDTLKKMKILRTHSFKVICNSLIKLLDEGKDCYISGKFNYSYVKYMTVINIFSDVLPTLKNFDRSLSEYNVLRIELDAALENIVKLKEHIKEEEEKSKAQQQQNSSLNSYNSVNTSRNNSTHSMGSPRSGDRKTIVSEKIYQYISRIESGKENNAPQILLIDIREPKEYENGHINFINEKFQYSGVINIPLGSFYGMKIDINSLLADAERKESNEQKKALIRNICESDLIIYYDEQTSNLNIQVYQIISDVLFHNNYGRKIKRPPVMLENGYKGWLEFLQKSGISQSRYTESSNLVDVTSRKIEAMNIGSQNVNNINKDKMNNYSNNYYLQYAATGSEFMASTQPLNSNMPVNYAYNSNPMIPTAPIAPTALSAPSAPVNSYYNNIDVTPNAPAIGQPSYPKFDEAQISMPQPVPTNISSNNYNYPLPTPNQIPAATAPTQSLSNSAGYPSLPQLSVPSQPHQTQPSPVVPPKPNIPLSPATAMNPNRIPPAIPERNRSKNALNKLGKGSSSLDSINTYPVHQLNNGNGEAPKLPPKPIFSPNEIHNKSHGTVGLRNLGNTCYMNSILQCLNATEPLTRYFLRGNFKEAINRENSLGTHGHLAMEYSNFLNTIWLEHLPVVSPTNIKDIISKFNSEFKGSDQHDSQEFLSCILDGLHEDLNVARKKSKDEIDKIRKEHSRQEKEEENGNFALQTLQNNYWKRYIDINYSIIVTTFQGQYMSSLTCTRCNKASRTFNSLMYLSVPIPSNATNLYHCLDKYIEVEHLDGNDAWSCPNCKIKVNATKQLILSKLPNIMMIHLKRFYFQGPFKDKITKNITFPLKGLDLQKYTYPFQCNENKYKYNLFAISNHYGTLSGGHYTAFVRDKSTNNWISFDDSRISDISESKIMTNAAYILFYERVA